jgi:hypothetical protein
MSDIKTQWLKWVSEIQAISQSGMVYAHNESKADNTFV